LPDLSGKGIFFFVLLVFPGFVAQSIYELYVPVEDRDAGTRLFLSLAYGILNFALTWPLILPALSTLSSHLQLSWSSSIPYLQLIASLVIIPAVIGYSCYRVRYSSWFALNPSPTAWDDFFRRGSYCWIIFHLKDGSKIGAYYGRDSHASSFPNDQDIYVSQVWRIDESGRFQEQIERTQGLLIRRQDCNMIEFFSEADPL